MGSPNEMKCNIKPCSSELHRGKEIAGSVQSSVFKEISTPDGEGLLPALNLPQEVSGGVREGGISMPLLHLRKVKQKQLQGLPRVRPTSLGSFHYVHWPK